MQAQYHDTGAGGASQGICGYAPHTDSAAHPPGIPRLPGGCPHASTPSVFSQKTAASTPAGTATSEQNYNIDPTPTE